MEVRGAGRKAAQDRPFNLPTMIEVAVNQSLAKVGSCFAIGSRNPRRRVGLAYSDRGQIADVQASQVRRRIGRIGIAGPDVQWRWKRMIAHVGRVMASPTRPLQRGDA